MTDQEINRALALAVGWKDVQVVNKYGDVLIAIDQELNAKQPRHRLFDYRDPAVIWPIAERFNCFPYALRDKDQKLTGRWNAWASAGVDVSADTAAKAVAMAVIKAKESK